MAKPTLFEPHSETASDPDVDENVHTSTNSPPPILMTSLELSPMTDQDEEELVPSPASDQDEEQLVPSLEGDEELVPSDQDVIDPISSVGSRGADAIDRVTSAF